MERDMVLTVSFEYWGPAMPRATSVTYNKKRLDKFL